MNLVISGIQGSGKGTQSALIANKYGLEHISVGDCIAKYLLASPEFVYPYTIEQYKSGELAPNDIVIKVANKEIQKATNGFILDGFPRQLDQMKYLIDNIEIDHLIILSLSDSECMKRLNSRGRSDDTQSGISKRISLYKNVTYPILEEYSEHVPYTIIDASASVDSVFDEICSILDIHSIINKFVGL